MKSQTRGCHSLLISITIAKSQKKFYVRNDSETIIYEYAILTSTHARY